MRLHHDAKEPTNPKSMFIPRAHGSWRLFPKGIVGPWRKAVKKRLQDRTPASWPREQVTRLDEEPSEYLVHVSPDLRAFIRVLDSGSIEIARHRAEEALRLFQGQQRPVVTQQ